MQRSKKPQPLILGGGGRKGGCSNSLSIEFFAQQKKNYLSEEGKVNRPVFRVSEGKKGGDLLVIKGYDSGSPKGRVSEYI